MIPEIADYLSEIEEERKNRGWKPSGLSMEAFGNPCRYSHILNTQGDVGPRSLKALAEALDMKLVICLMEAK